MTTTNYLDYAGLQRFKTNLDALYASLYRTEAQVESQISDRLSAFKTNYVQIVPDVPEITGGQDDPEEGIIYLVPDSDAAPGTFAYVAYGVERVNNTPTVVRIGAGTTVLPNVSQTVVEDDTDAVSGDGVFKYAVAKTDVSSTVVEDDPKVVTGEAVFDFAVAKSTVVDQVADNNMNVVTSNAVYDYAVAKTDVNSTIVEDDPKVVTGEAVFDFAVAKTSIVDQVADNNQNPVTSNAVYDYAVALANVADTIADNNMNPVTSNAVYDALANIQAIPNPEIDVMFMPSTEIWIDSTGWPTMKAKYETSGEFVPLTKNSSGYYVIVPGEVASVDTLVLATADDSISTGVLTDVTSASDLAGFNGKIVAAEDQATTLTVLA